MIQYCNIAALGVYDLTRDAMRYKRVLKCCAVSIAQLKCVLLRKKLISGLAQLTPQVKWAKGERGINSILDLFLRIYCISRSQLYPHLLQLLISICRLYLQLYTQFVSFVIFVSHPWDSLYFIKDYQDKRENCK